jgi:hypothetical protein
MNLDELQQKTIKYALGEPVWFTEYLPEGEEGRQSIEIKCLCGKPWKFSYIPSWSVECSLCHER